MSGLKKITSSNSAKILIGWVFVIGAGVEAFILAKGSIDRNRREAMLIRQRMAKSNTGDYDKPTARTSW